MLKPKPMEKIISVNCTSPDGVSVSSVDYSLDSDTQRAIIQAQEIIKANPILKYVKIDGSKVWNTVKQFDSTIDDEDRKLIPEKDTFEFRSDIQHIEVDKWGYAYVRALNKYAEGDDLFLSFEIE